MTVVIIAGMHRSGTSVASRVCNLLGVELGSNMGAASDENQKGFWEHLGIVEAHERLLEDLGQRWDSTESLPDDWLERPVTRRCRDQLHQIIEDDFKGKQLWGFKDPRVARLIPLWRDLLGEIGASGRFVIPYRHPRAVADSLHRRDGFSLEKGYLLWLTHILEADAATRGTATGFVEYEAFFRDWRETVTRLAQALELEWPVPLDRCATEVESFIDPALRHSSAAMDDATAVSGFNGWADRVFRALSHSDGDANVRNTELDAVREMFVEARRVFVPWRDETSLTRDIEHLRAENREVTRHRQELEASVLRAGDDLSTLGAGLEDARNYVTALESSRAELQAGLEDARNYVMALESSRAELQAGLEDARNHVTALESSRAELRAGLEDARNHVTALEQARDEVRAALELAHARVATLEAAEQRLLAANVKLARDLRDTNELAAALAQAGTALLSSKRWRFGHAIGNVLSLVRLRPTGCPAADALMVNVRALERHRRSRMENG